MRVRSDRLNEPGKLYYWIEETWPGFPPTTSYRDQAAILRRRADALSYVEKGWDDGIVVMLFNLPDKAGFLQLVCVENPEQLTTYLRTNEAHTCLSPDCRKVTAMAHWDSGKEAFLQMIARMVVRAKYEVKQEVQPSQLDLNTEATSLRAGGELKSLFARLA